MSHHFDTSQTEELRRLYSRTTPAERLKRAMRASLFAARLRAATERAERRG